MVVANQARSDELAIIISYLTSASRIIVSLKTPTKYREFVFRDCAIIIRRGGGGLKPEGGP